MRPRNAVVSVVRAIGLEAALACHAWMADRVPSALPYRSTGYIVHGIKRRSSSYNHPRLEHIMEEGTQRAKARSIVRLCRFAPAARSGPLARAPMPVASPRARYPETRQTSPRRRSYPGTPLTRARYAASDADGRAHPPVLHPRPVSRLPRRFFPSRRFDSFNNARV